MKDIVKFGKYKDKPIAALAQDKEYVEWLLATPWFKQQHGDLYNIVINNFQTPQDTPEHNKIQIKFLEESYIFKFAFVAIGEKLFSFGSSQQDEDWLRILKDLVELYATKYESELENINRSILYDTKCIKNHPGTPAAKMATENLALDENKLKSMESKNCSIQRNIKELIGNFDQQQIKLLSISDLNFESKKSATDVSFKINYGCLACEPLWAIEDKLNKKFYSFQKTFIFTIEIKPQVFDDYPSILRQMKHNNSKYLFISEYNGVGATLEQFKSYFETQGIKVIFESDVDSCELPIFDEYYNFSFFDKLNKILNFETDIKPVNWSIKYEGRKWSEVEVIERNKILPAKISISDGMLMDNESDRINLLNMLFENVGVEKSLDLMEEKLIKKYAKNI